MTDVDPRSYEATVTTPCETCGGTGSIETTETRIDEGRSFRNAVEVNGESVFVWGTLDEEVQVEGETVTIVAEDQTITGDVIE